MVFLIILMAILAFILVKLKGDQGKIPKLLKLNSSGSDSKSIRVLERSILEGRKNLYLVETFGKQCFLIGTTETEIVSLGEVQRPDGEQSFDQYLEHHEADNKE